MEFVSNEVQIILKKVLKSRKKTNINVSRYTHIFLLETQFTVNNQIEYCMYIKYK